MEALNTEELIIKEIARQLSVIFSKTGIKQSILAEKMGISQGNVSLLLKGDKNRRKLDNYRALAEAIPISRSEFDSIVESAKRKVLGDSGIHNVSDDPKYATLRRHPDLSADDLEKAISIYKTLQK